MSWIDIILSAIGVILGGIITCVVAKIYYQKASKELQNEANELRRLNILMLRALEKTGLAEFGRDEDGNFKGLAINLSSKIEAKSETSSAKVTVD